MPPERHGRANTPYAAALDLPPPFQLVTLREVGDAFAHATAQAAQLGAGTLVYVGRFDLAEFALVLEPNEPLRTARRAFYAGMAALADALAAHAPPEKPMAIDWPDAVSVDGGLVGGGRLAWAEGPEDEPPAWLVFGAMIRTVAMGEGEPGLRPLVAALEEEGFDELGSGRLAESFARHFMVAVDAWQEQGFGAVAKSYIAYLAPEPGARREIADNGDLLIQRVGTHPTLPGKRGRDKGEGKAEVERRSLLPVLSSPTWFDPQKRGPR
jgi:biotin-(acetyl-CoA carboxylase) ligase